MNKKLLIGVVNFFIIVMIICIFIIYKYITKPTKYIQNVEYVYINNDSIITELNHKIDSLNERITYVKDSADNELSYALELLFVANYKLERIREYNKIAKSGNNIKFLRGWINRVLEE